MTRTDYEQRKERCGKCSSEHERLWRKFKIEQNRPDKKKERASRSRQDAGDRQRLIFGCDEFRESLPVIPGVGFVNSEREEERNEGERVDERGDKEEVRIPDAHSDSETRQKWREAEKKFYREERLALRRDSAVFELIRSAIKRAVETEQYADDCSAMRKDAGCKRPHVRERGDRKNSPKNKSAQHVAANRAERERRRQYRYRLRERIEEKGADDRVYQRRLDVCKVEKKNNPHERAYCRMCKARQKTMQDERKGGISWLDGVRHVMCGGSGACFVCGARSGMVRSSK